MRGTAAIWAAGASAALMLAAGIAQGEHTFTLDEFDRAFERADEETVRLAPDAFNNLPAEIQDELTARRCTVPQTFFAEYPQVSENVEPDNVVRGNFTQAGQTDIAVLCSRKRVSSILVFRGGSALEVDELASEPDARYLQGVGNGDIGFSRMLGAASPEYIRSCYEALQEHEVPVPPPLDHEGIEDYFVEKASTIWYWYGGKWLSLAGAD